MTRTSVRNFLRSIVVVGIVGAAASATPAMGETVCGVVPGHVEFLGLEVDPPNPVVGDIVYLSFDVRSAVYFVSSVRLYGAYPIFHGSTSSESRTRFVLDTVLVGEAGLQLEITYGTEEYCEDEDGGGYYTPGPYLSERSEVFVVSVGEPAPSTPTPGCTPPLCPTGTPSCVINAEPSAAPRGAEVTVSGTCAGILYHRDVFLHLGASQVAWFDGVGPDYTTTFTVPWDTLPGNHDLSLHAPFGEATTTFEVTGEAPGCVGDCNQDERVTVGELITGVALALRNAPIDQCDAIDADSNGNVAIGELITAANAALVGCETTVSCRDDSACSPPKSCRSPLGPEGFDTRCTTDRDCPDAERCDRGGHCVPSRCRGTGECPPGHFCYPLGSSTARQCVHASCGSECNDGFCVNDVCWDSVGICAY